MVGSILIIAAGTIAGYAQAHKLSMRVLFMEQYLRLLRYLQTEIRYCAGALPQILAGFSKDTPMQQCINDCIKNIEEGNSFSGAWQQAVANISHEYGLAKEDYRLISEFGTGLGTSDIQGQLSHCEMHITFLTQRLEEAQENKKKKSKLYFMLGLFLGIGSTLLFI